MYVAQCLLRALGVDIWNRHELFIVVRDCDQATSLRVNSVLLGVNWGAWGGLRQDALPPRQIQNKNHPPKDHWPAEYRGILRRRQKL